MILTIRSIRVAVETVVSTLAPTHDPRENDSEQPRESRDDRG